MGVTLYFPGQKIGPKEILYLKSIPIDERKNRRRPEGWFQCPDCGQPFRATIHNIVTGNTKRCNNHRAEIMAKTMAKDLTNQRFGKLTALYWTGKKEGSNRVWLCQCDCGEVKEVNSNHLLQGKIISCGKCIGSAGEQLIKKALEELNVNFAIEYIFKDCINPKTKQKLRFDFYLPEYNCCIEFDGEQHFKEWNLGRDTLADRQYRDNIKNQYCQDNNIKLIRIPYTELNNINEEYLRKRVFNV